MKTATKIVTAIVSVGVLAGAGVGTFFIIKNINEENHKKDIEMAADCARTFDYPVRAANTWINASGYIDDGVYTEITNNRRNKRQECAEKYHVTQQEIIDKIGTETYSPR